MARLFGASSELCLAFFRTRPSGRARTAPRHRLGPEQAYTG
ncbi:hypothetical protein ACGFRB_18120 [Streptomyces sp. NPDC048718]